jgi:hypothetical protein
VKRKTNCDYVTSSKGTIIVANLIRNKLLHYPVVKQYNTSLATKFKCDITHLKKSNLMKTAWLSGFIIGVLEEILI